MNILDRFHNWRRQMRWNKQYRKGRWNSLRHDSENSRYEAIVNFMTERGKKSPSILDLGCGEGVLNEKLPVDYAYSYFMGVDFSKVSIENAKTKNFPNADFVCADIHFFTPPRKFDIIIFNEAFYYVNIKERENVRNRILKHLEDDGILIVSMYRDATDCWDVLNAGAERLDFVTITTNEEKKYWKVGVYKLKH